MSAKMVCTDRADHSADDPLVILLLRLICSWLFISGDIVAL